MPVTDIISSLVNLPTLRLSKGPGTHRNRRGCWMVALTYYQTDGARWHDMPSCVHPMIRGLCIHINDALHARYRGRVIGPYLLEPYGTSDGAPPEHALTSRPPVPEEHREAVADFLADLQTLPPKEGFYTPTLRKTEHALRHGATVSCVEFIRAATQTLCQSLCSYEGRTQGSGKPGKRREFKKFADIVEAEIMPRLVTLCDLARKVQGLDTPPIEPSRFTATLPKTCLLPSP
jgi:hypothetical protein